MNTLTEYNRRVESTTLTGQARKEAEKRFINEHRNGIKRCPYCNGNIKDRKITSWKGLINSLYKIYRWCGERKRHEFVMKDVRHFMGRSEYANFSSFVRAGGIIYRPLVDGKKKISLYGINMARAKEFFSGTRTIPIQITINQITGEIVEQVDGYVGEFPELSELLTKEGLFDYEMPIQEKLL